MYELNRIRLFEVGPRGARYSDVTLDLSGVGAPVATTGSLFGPPVRRPSPYSLLLLENGGGKSVLLKLLFSVVLPGKRNTVGGSAAVMDKFVLGDDAAHVVLEWMHVTTGARVVTGKVLQRRRSAGADGRLAEAFWSLRPHSGVEIDELPFVRDGRRLRLDGFREALQEIDRAVPATQLTWNNGEVGEWATHLRSLNLEPDLFSIQRRMNADEGDAANAFKFKTSRDFVDWLLRVVLDPDDATSVAENFDSYATTVGDRAAMLLERDFVAGAVDTLTPAAQAYGRLTAARTAREQAERHGAQLLAAVQARVLAESETTARLRTDTEDAAKEAATREGERDRARDTVNEIRRQTLALELAAAKARQQAATDSRDAAIAELRAWAATDLLERAAAADEQASQMAARITDAEQGARPALAARDEAAGRLLAKLHAEARTAREERDAHDRAAAAHTATAADRDRDRTTELLTAERTRAEHGQVTRHLAQVKAQVDAAVSTGLLRAGEEPRAASTQAADAADAAVTNLTAAEVSLQAAADDVARAATDVREADEALVAARSSQAQASAAVQEVTDRAARLISDELVLAALATDAADVDLLDTAAEALAAQLAEDESARDDKHAELKSAQRDDQRILDALGDGGLLPARVEVEQTLQVLHAAGLAAHAGWTYLAENAHPQERAALIAANPALADGVVLVDSAALPAARHALAEARLLPSAAIAVADGGALLTAPEHLGGRTPFVVEPTPAMFDLAAAERRRLEVRDAMDARGVQIDALVDTLTRLREVRTELTLWRRLCPPGRLQAVREASEAADAALAESSSAASTARTAAAHAGQRHADSAAALTDARAHERQAADRASALARLAEAVTAAEEQRRRLGELEETAAAAERRAATLTADRDREQAAAHEAARAAENARDRAERHVASMNEVATSTGEPAAHVPVESLSALRGAYSAAVTAYQAVEVGQDLRAAADRAEIEAARLRSELAGRDGDDVARARALLSTGDGADPASRQAAVARLERERERYDAAIGSGHQQVGRLRSELRAATPSDHDRNVWTTLPDERRPTSAEHGQKLLEVAAAEQRTAQEVLEAAVARNAALARQAHQAAESTRTFKEVVTPLAVLLEQAETPVVEAAAFVGEAAEARGQAERVQADLRTTTAEERAAESAVAKLVDATVRFANQPRFETMTNVARRALVGLEREQVAARADEFAGQLSQRLATLSTDLDSASRHRKLIIDRLCALVDGALKTLRTASRLSKLPVGLGDWEGKEFLRIRFPAPDPSLLAARVGEVVDDMAAAVSGRQPGARGSAPKRDGLALLLRSIEAAVPKGFTVDVLKPDAVLRDERVPVESMNEVFSGGQELTAAIVLYCTMAALRENERGQLRARHSGVLFLDNPIGKASAEYLLELQQGVATALGVQLVYTTGLSDDRALAAFPLWVRMRNDADLRAGLKHIRVAKVVRRELPEPFADEDLSSADQAPGTVTATRVFRRPA